MAGLLAFPQFTSLMSGMSPAAMTKPRPMMADAEDERMFAANPNGDQLNQLLGALLLGQKEVPAMAQAAAPEAAPQAQMPAMAPMPSAAVLPAPGGAVATPQRQRVSGWRVLDRVLGGETITGGLDAERARLQAEAERPQMQNRMEELRRIARGMGDAALIAFETNPTAFGESVGYQQRPQVVAPGAIQAIAGRAAVGAPQQYEFGDQRRSFNPVTQEDSLIASRGPTIAEQNDAERNRIAALGAGQSTVGRFRLGPDGQPLFEAPSEFTLSGGQKRFEDGSEVAAVAPTVAPSPVNAEITGRIDSARRETLPTATQMRTLLSSGDVITGFGANARLDAARALAALGNEDAKRQVAATQQYQNLSGGLRVALAKSLGANPSNADILLLEKITAGDINQSSEALLATVSLAEQRANALVSDLERQLQTAAPQAASAAGPIATNPATGERVQWNGSAWVPI